MKLLIKFPTRNRSYKFLNTLSIYLRYLDNKNTSIIVSADTDDETMRSPEVCNFIKVNKNIILHYGNNNSKISAINADLDGIDFDILLLASDDMIPQVQGYDTIIKNTMKMFYPDTDGVLWFNDGYQQDRLNTLCILGKKYYDRFGYIYFPGYSSVWCDNEFMDVANFLKKQTYINDVIIKHEHPDYGFGSYDKNYQRNVINESTDHKLYLNRKEKNFEL